MSGPGEIDPVMFGKLIADVQHASEQIERTMGVMQEFVNATNARFSQQDERIDKQDTKINDMLESAAVKKGAIIGALGGGAVGGISLTEMGKRIIEKIMS